LPSEEASIGGVEKRRVGGPGPILSLLACGLYSARPDKGYSLVDCISMQTMWREGIAEVLTNDRHFEQEGFRALFRDS
jgi:hypothetical protein